MSNKKTLEEAIKQELENHFFSNISEIKQAEYFINFGAKWHQEQDKNKFSEEDMIEFGKFCHSDAHSINRVKTFKELFEQFKNK